MNPNGKTDTVRMHKKSITLIKKASTMAKKRGAKCILLTHHKPIMDGDKNEFQFCYESDLSNLIRDPYILTAHGHTHRKYMKKVNGVLSVSNPHGYPGEKTKFDSNFCVELIV